MELDQAYKIVKVSPEEEGSIQRYLGFQHTGMNILADLTPEYYENLNKSGWKLPETAEEIKSAILDFVNIYAAMYKESKGKNVQKNLVRGTSRKNIPMAKTEIHQMLSTSTDESVAKTFCKYGDAALIYFQVGQGVPFLNVDSYRDEDRADEKEIILSPFCKVSRSHFTSEYDGYAYYDITVEKTELLEMSDEEIQITMNDVIQGFSQNIEDMKNCIELSDTLEILNERIKRTVHDREEQVYLAEIQQKNFDEYCLKSKKTSRFREKLQNLLKGLCKQKELEIDRAYDVIDVENKRKQEATREEIKINMISEVSEKKDNAPKESTKLQDILVSGYEELIQSESAVTKMATSLQVPFNKKISTTSIKSIVTDIQENVKILQQKINQTTFSEQDSYESVYRTFNDITPVCDSISYGLKIAEDIPDIVTMYQKQAEQEVKKNLYMKVQKVIQEAKVQKYLKDRDIISSEGMSFLGGITGRNDLQVERLNNINLKIQLAQSTVPQEQGNYSVRDMLADLYACATVELGGNFTPEMRQLYDSMKKVFSDKEYSKFTDEYIAELARDKIIAEQNENLPVLPTKKSFLGRNKAQAELLRLENRRLNSQILEAKSKKTFDVYTVSEEDAISMLKTKLELIECVTIDKSALRERKNLVKTFDFFS